jgi:hypothetical protein
VDILGTIGRRFLQVYPVVATTPYAPRTPRSASTGCASIFSAAGTEGEAPTAAVHDPNSDLAQGLRYIRHGFRSASAF